MRRDGKFIGVDGTVPEGQGIVMAHLNECHELLEMVGHQNQPMWCVTLNISSQLKQRMDEGQDDDFEDDEDEYTFESGSDSEDESWCDALQPFGFM